jgi:hypothetical protein
VGDYIKQVVSWFDKKTAGYVSKTSIAAVTVAVPEVPLYY